MLTITQDAADAIRSIVSASDLSEGAGIRIFAKPVTETEATLELSLTEGPAESDSVVEEQGAQVFLDPNAATYLGDKVLGAAVEGEEVRFTIESQGPETGGAPETG